MSWRALALAGAVVPACSVVDQKSLYDCRYEGFSDLCRVTHVHTEPAPTGDRDRVTATFVVDSKGGSHFDESFELPRSSTPKFVEYLRGKETRVSCTGEVLASGRSCPAKTRGTIDGLSGYALRGEDGR
jgi:hypothetical protein